MLLCSLLDGGDRGLRRAGQFPAEFRGVYTARINGLVARFQTGRTSALLHWLRSCDRLWCGCCDGITTSADVTEIAYRSHRISNRCRCRRDTACCDNRRGIRRRWSWLRQTRRCRQLFDRQPLLDRRGRCIGVPSLLRSSWNPRKIWKFHSSRDCCILRFHSV